ncbi:MAG: penicillin-binding protein 2 [Bacteriovoracia bacterium]
MSFLGQDEQIREYQFRFRYLYICLFMAFFILVARLWYLQIINGDKFKRFSEENHIKKVKIPAPRGMIFDRNKTLLVDNQPAFDLEITPQELSASKNSKKILEKLSKMIKMPAAEIERILEDAKGQFSYLPVRIKQDLTNDEVGVIEAHKLDLPGVSIQIDIRRTHIYHDMAAHLMGYIGEINPNELPSLNKKIDSSGIPYKMGDVIGKFGLESRWEPSLRGIDGEEYIEVDALGHRKKTVKGITSSLSPKPSVPGKNLILTLDQTLQLVAREAFEKLYKDKKIGAVIALNVKTGEILASMSQPSFNPTAFSRGVSTQLWNSLLQNKYHPLRDKTIQDHYSPGSTFKVVTAIAGLEEKAIDEHTTFNCAGSIRLGNRSYRCWSRSGHGNINVVNALTHSCDVFFYRLGQKLGIDTIAKYATMMGLGKQTGVNLAHEETGLIPTEAWKLKRYKQEWIAGETLSCAIGQSYILTTPIQLASIYGLIANGGALFRPYIVKQIESPDGSVLKQFQPDKIRDVGIRPETLALIRKGLWGVTNTPGGTAYRQMIPGIEVGAKTGTTQVVRMSDTKVNQKCESMPFDIRDNGTFVAYAPADDPEIAVAVVAEHSCHGASGAGPIAMAVIKAYLQKYHPEKYSDEILAQKAAKMGRIVRQKAVDTEDSVRMNDVTSEPAAPLPSSPDELEETE